MYSADRRVMSGAVGANAGASGSAIVAAVGARLGLAGLISSVRMGASAGRATAWVSDTSVQCLGGGRVGGSLRVSVSGGGRIASVTRGLSGDAWGLSVVGRTRRSNGASMGSVSWTVSGRGLGVGAWSHLGT